MKVASLFFAVLAATLLFSSSSSAQNAEEIVAKTIAARGGLEKIKAVQSEKLSGTISVGPGASGPFQIELKRPGKLHAEFTFQGQTLIRVFDGKNGWVLNPFAGDKEAQPMSAEDVHTISDESDYDGPLVDYLAKGHKLEFVKKEELNGQPVFRLKLTQNNGEIRFYLFDATTYQLHKGETTRTIEGQAYPVETFFSDYRDVNGLKFAFKIESHSLGQDQQQTITIDKIDLNTPIDDTRFAKPLPPAPPASPASQNYFPMGFSRKEIFAV